MRHFGCTLTGNSKRNGANARKNKRMTRCASKGTVSGGGAQGWALQASRNGWGHPAAVSLFFGRENLKSNTAHLYLFGKTLHVWIEASHGPPQLSTRATTPGGGKWWDGQ
ncbi:hypothetical protein TRVL_07679 [Trypanosoma vivax]|nr:hypothetical protein TRVL_07679 [Trypanosoma vivax]